ncbi:hypothetical protein HW555_003965 [Spodoptera exigua]|uniref:Kazal-like domain-containing protein n=1 Tax=Spodoptera exigua TaxID=7107 RepID=A0A835GMT8_SPOEX|nr:hypothetical protein HW555_003965 [Spodoptera exigua]
MYLAVGIILTASVLMAALPGSKSSCTSFAALAEPCGCTISKESFDPLCGSDGATYLNQCFLECEKMLSNIDIKVHHKGMCISQSRCSCHARYEPVCATNGVTYSNNCVLTCNSRKDSSIRMRHNGECQNGGQSRWTYTQTPQKLQSSQKRACDCSLNSMVYYFRCGGATRDTCVCATSQPTSEQLKNICNNNKNNYAQPLKVNYIQPTKHCTCAAVHKPVCGNNHVTYANICVLHCYATKDSSIRFMKMGDCSGDGNDPRLVSRFGTGGKWKDKTLLRVRHFRG